MQKFLQSSLRLFPLPGLLKRLFLSNATKKVKAGKRRALGLKVAKEVLETYI